MVINFYIHGYHLLYTQISMYINRYHLVYAQISLYLTNSTCYIHRYHLVYTWISLYLTDITCYISQIQQTDGEIRCWRIGDILANVSQREAIASAITTQCRWRRHSSSCRWRTHSCSCSWRTNSSSCLMRMTLHSSSAVVLCWQYQCYSWIWQDGQDHLWPA